ncbi:MAG: DPP IV N-terminal domain-containing protein [Thermomicrobiaceae bacterium]
MTRANFMICKLLIAVGLLTVIAACGEIEPEVDSRFEAGQQPEGRILFAASGDIHLWDGSSERLTDYGDASAPAWSEDGEEYLFVRMGDAYSDLVLAEPDSSSTQRVTANQPNSTPGSEEYLARVSWALDPVWSPSGNGVAYVSDAGTDNNFLWHRSTAAGDPWRVPCSQRYNDNVERPSFSPNGTKIVFAQRTSAQADMNRWMELRICDLNSGELTELVGGDAGDSAFFPRWSPDGDWIAFVRRLEGQTDIWVVPADGGEPVQLTEKGNVTAPEWSPDGEFIAFFEPDGSTFKASVMGFDAGDGDEPSASDPEELFSVDNVDPASGMSWTE